MLTLTIALLVGGVPERFDLLGMRNDIDDLKARVAAIEAKTGTQAKPQKATTATVDKAEIVIYSPAVKPKFGPVAAAAKTAAAVANVATAPVRWICNGNSCQAVSEPQSIESATMPMEYGNMSGGACQGGNCYQPARRGFFGRRR